MKCILINGTRDEAIISESNGVWERRNGIVPAGGKFTIRNVDPNATYREFWISLDTSFFKSDSRTATVLSSENFLMYSEISIQELPDGDFFLEGTKSRESFNQDREAVHTSVKGVSLKFDEALRSCKDLEKLYGSAKICRHQCEHLLQTYKEGIQKMAHLYSSLIEDDEQIVEAYRDDRLTKVEKSLDSLEYIVCEMKELLNSCAKELGKVALVVSSRKPPVEKDMEVYSDFDMLVRELEWHLDVMEFLIGPQGQVMFEWSPTMCKYVLKREVVAQEKAPNQEKPRSLACVDREELQSGLEDGSIYIPNTIYGWCKRCLFGVSKENSIATILKRCKTQDLQNLDAFEIDHLDLHPGGELGRGSAKKVYEGTWYEQSVAIATIKMADPDSDDSDDPDDANKPPTPSQIFRDEVKRLLQLQHPKVVSLFGWAEAPDTPAPIKNAKDIDCVRGGYIVTEKMEYNLETVIQMRKKQRSLKGLGPFSNSVEIDILLQIVDAMLHVQNHAP